MLLLYQLQGISANGAPGFPKYPEGTFGASAGKPADRRWAAERAASLTPFYFLLVTKKPHPSFQEMGLPCFATYYLLK